jgi:hypothetical protein
MDKIFENYNSWCQYLHLESNIRYVTQHVKVHLVLVNLKLIDYDKF